MYSIDGWMDGWMDKWMDGWIHFEHYLIYCASCNFSKSLISLFFFLRKKLKKMCLACFISFLSFLFSALPFCLCCMPANKTKVMVFITQNFSCFITITVDTQAVF